MLTHDGSVLGHITDIQRGKWWAANITRLYANPLPHNAWSQSMQMGLGNFQAQNFELEPRLIPPFTLTIFETLIGLGRKTQEARVKKFEASFN